MPPRPEGAFGALLATAAEELVACAASGMPHELRPALRGCASSSCWRRRRTSSTGPRRPRGPPHDSASVSSSSAAPASSARRAPGCAVERGIDLTSLNRGASQRAPAARGVEPPARRRPRPRIASRDALGDRRLRRGRRLGRLHARARASPTRPVPRAHRAVRLHQLGLGLPDAAGAPADHRVDAAAQPVLAVLARQDRLRGPARRAPTASDGLPGHHRAPVAHLRPRPCPPRRRLDGGRPDAPGQAGRRARRRHLAVDAHPPHRLRPRLRRPARQPARRSARPSTSPPTTCSPGTRSPHALGGRAGVEPRHRARARRT